jgi:transcriptional regulator with XRE-family HTH domain
MKGVRFKRWLLCILMAEKGYTARALRDALAERGIKVTTQAIYEWRRRRHAPSGQALSALCDIFGVEATAWFEKVSENKEAQHGKH